MNYSFFNIRASVSSWLYFYNGKESITEYGYLSKEDKQLTIKQYERFARDRCERKMRKKLPN